MKRIKDIFTELNSKSNLNEAFVEGVVVDKETKTLNMKITSNDYIEIKQIIILNKYVKKRFALEDSFITVKYSEGTVKKPITEEMPDIIDLLSDSFPVLRATLNNCLFEVSNEDIKFKFKNTISNYLKSNNYDKEIGKCIENIYGSSYNIVFFDDVGDEEIEKLMDDMQAKEIQIIKDQEKQKEENNLSRRLANSKENTQNSSNGKNSDDLILGRSSNIKEAILKISDISPDEGKVAIEGDITNVDSRELRSGKF